MHCQAIVFGDHPERLMNSLIGTPDRTPADVRVPLQVDHADGRSGWHTVNADNRQLDEPSGYAYGGWVHCVWPTAFLRDHLGPHALLDDQALSSLELPRHHVQKAEGQWWARVPRFFRTVGAHWSTVPGSSRWQGDGSDDAVDGATVGSLDLQHNLMSHDPNLVVGPTGPVFYQRPDGGGRDVVQRRLEAALPLMDLPPQTPVTLVSWHDSQRDRYRSYTTDSDPAGTIACTCFASVWDQPYRHPTHWDY
jgi:hypothetical protein